MTWKNNFKKLFYNCCHRLKFIFAFFCIVFQASCDQNEKDPEPEEPTKVPKSFYVSATGNDVNVGSQTAPFKTIAKALESIVAGDTVMVRGGTYYEKVRVTKSGEENKYIVIKSFPGETAIISGKGLDVNGAEGLVEINGASWITLEGFDICNFKTTGSWVAPKGLVVQKGSDNVQLKNNNVYNIENNATLANGRGGNGILIIGNTSDPVTNILVEGNTVHDCNTGYGENLTINGYVDGFIIRNNTVYNGENIGIDAAGGYAANPIAALNYARNGTIVGNKVHNVETASGPLGGYGAIGIYVDGARNITVEQNWVYDSDRGIGIISETNNFPTQDCIVRNNFVFNCWRAGIMLGGYLNYSGAGTNNCYVLNNTLYQNNKVLGYFGEVEGEIRLTEDCNNNVIKNNIVYARSENDVFVHKYTSTGSNNVIDYNLYYSAGTTTWIWNGVQYTDFNAWKSASDADRVSTIGVDPQLESTSAPDLHIKSTSPATNAGVIISSQVHGEKDIDGQTRIVNDQISKGADQK